MALLDLNYYGVYVAKDSICFTYRNLSDLRWITSNYIYSINHIKIVHRISVRVTHSELFAALGIAHESSMKYHTVISNIAGI